MPLEALRYLKHVFAHRRCYVCRVRGWCGHREPMVEMAEQDAAADVLEAHRERFLVDFGTENSIDKATDIVTAEIDLHEFRDDRND